MKLKLRKLFIAAVAISAFLLAGYDTQAVHKHEALPSANTSVNHVKRAEAVLDLTQKEKLTVDALIEEAKIIGYSKALVCGAISEEGVEKQGFVLCDKQGNVIKEEQGILFEDKYYAKFEGLESGKEYTVTMYGFNDDERISPYSTLLFTTPKIIFEKDKIISELNQQISADNLPTEEPLSSAAKEQTAILRTQQFMKLLNLRHGKERKYNLELQLNQLRLEYSYNSYGRFVLWDNVDGIPDMDIFDTVAEILQTKAQYSQEDFIYPFVPAPHALAEYNSHNENGGQIDIERYIYDMLAENEKAYESYKEYPFIYDTDEFRTKYAELAASKENGQYNGMQIEYTIAQNKAKFSYRNQEWMQENAHPYERTILIAQEHQHYYTEVIVQAATAYSYLFMEIPTDEGMDELAILCAYRSYSTQSLLYSKRARLSEVVKESGLWHYNRQIKSFVPGFSNHQYGIAIDMYKIATFRSSNLYPYLQENAEKYGFYNYYVEPWHWVYLGE